MRANLYNPDAVTGHKPKMRQQSRYQSSSLQLCTQIQYVQPSTSRLSNMPRGMSLANLQAIGAVQSKAEKP